MVSLGQLEISSVWLYFSEELVFMLQSICLRQGLTMGPVMGHRSVVNYEISPQKKGRLSISLLQLQMESGMLDCMARGKSLKKIIKISQFGTFLICPYLINSAIIRHTLDNSTADYMKFPSRLTGKPICTQGICFIFGHHWSEYVI